MYDTTPQSIELREIRYVITKPGRKQDPFAIVTTMTDVDGEDAVQYEDLAKLFGFRWNAELDIRNIQDTHELEPPTLQEPGEGPQGVLGDDAGGTMRIRTTALGSAWICGTRPREVSFVGCCQFVLAARDMIGTKTGMDRRLYCVSRLEQIGKCLIGGRPGRLEPRVRKKRGSNHNLMMQTREVLRARLADGDNSFETK